MSRWRSVSAAGAGGVTGERLTGALLELPGHAAALLEDAETIHAVAQEVTQWATVYFVSYILVASFVIVNLFIGIIVSAMDHVRDEELEASQESMDPREIASHIRALQIQLERFAASINASVASDDADELEFQSEG